MTPLCNANGNVFLTMAWIHRKQSGYGHDWMLENSKHQRLVFSVFCASSQCPRCWMEVQEVEVACETQAICTVGSEPCPFRGRSYKEEPIRASLSHLYFLSPSPSDNRQSMFSQPPFRPSSLSTSLTMLIVWLHVPYARLFTHTHKLSTTTE